MTATHEAEITFAKSTNANVTKLLLNNFLRSGMTLTLTFNSGAPLRIPTLWPTLVPQFLIMMPLAKKSIKEATLMHAAVPLTQTRNLTVQSLKNAAPTEA